MYKIFTPEQQDGEIVSMINYRDKVVIATKWSIWVLDEDDSGFFKIKNVENKNEL